MIGIYASVIVIVVIGQASAVEEECNILLNLESLESRVGLLESNLVRKSVQIGDLEKSLSEKKAQIADLETSQNEKNIRLNETETRIDELEKQRPGTVHAVGFNVRYPIGSVPSNQANFSVVMSNEGGALNAKTGVFTIPVAGTYYFSVALLRIPNSGDWAGCWIYSNGANLVWAHTWPAFSDKGHYVATASLYIRLAVGDTVYLAGCTTPIRDALHWSSSFSGFLVTPTV